MIIGDICIVWSERSLILNPGEKLHMCQWRRNKLQWSFFAKQQQLKFKEFQLQLLQILRLGGHSCRSQARSATPTFSGLWIKLKVLSLNSESIRSLSLWERKCCRSSRSWGTSMKRRHGPFLPSIRSCRRRPRQQASGTFSFLWRLTQKQCMGPDSQIWSMHTFARCSFCYISFILTHLFVMPFWVSQDLTDVTLVSEEAF